METIGASCGKSSRKGNADSYLQEDSGKYARYNAEQIEILEKEFSKGTNPKLSRRQQMISDFSVLANLDPNQIKVWFQNRRCRQKQKKEAIDLHLVNKKLIVTNRLLKEKNERLLKQVFHLVSENKNILLLKKACPESLDPVSGNCDLAGFPHQSSMDATDPSGLHLVAEETLAEFLSKATGTAIEWVQIPGLKFATDDIATVSISYNCDGVAARVCGLVSLKPIIIMETLKDRLSWLPDCRNLEVFSKFPANNGGTIELIYMQFYAPTTMDPVREFWMLRYTSTLDDGSIVVCEKSIASSENSPGQLQATASQFTRAKIMSSGYMIRPTVGGGSSIHIVDHLDLKTLTVPEILKPLYESSSLVAQKLTYAALRYVWKIAEERIPNTIAVVKKTRLHSFSHRLTREFNEAISAFSGDGWSLMDYDVTENLETSVNSIIDFSTTVDVGPLPFFEGVLCVKTSILLQDVSSTSLIRFLRDHRSEWADLSVDARLAASLKATSFTLSGLTSSNFSSKNMMFGHTFNDDDEVLERVDFQTHGLSQKDSILFQDVSLLQMCNGLDDNAIGACSELIFAPLHQKIPENAALLASGFRIFPLDSKSIKFCTRDVVEVTAGGPSPSSDSQSLLVAVFQFPFESHLREIVASMAKEYVKNVISSVRTIACTLRSSELIPAVRMKLTAGSPEARTLATWIYESYSSSFGVELLRPGFDDSDILYSQLWNHCDAIICFSFNTPMVCLFANQAALVMLETSLEEIQEMTIARIFGQWSLEKEMISNIPMIMEQGLAPTLSGGTFMSLQGHPVSYQQITAWRVLDDSESPHCVTFAFLYQCFS